MFSCETRMFAGLFAFLMKLTQDELKARGWQTQPRDDLGRWTDGAGNLSAAHVSTVLHSEGISDQSHHDAIQSKIKSGELRTRADVLAHIDSIHANSKAGVIVPKPPKPLEKMSKGERRAWLDTLTPAQYDAHIEAVSSPSLREPHPKDLALVQAHSGNSFDFFDDPKAAMLFVTDKVAHYNQALGNRDTALRNTASDLESGRDFGIESNNQARLYRRVGEAIRRSLDSNRKSNMDTLVTFGSEIKTVEETADSWKIGGYLVVFGTQDASNLKDKFTKETDFDIEDGDRTSIYYNHGLDGTIKRTKLGDGQLSIKDAGVWFEGELKKRTDYLQSHVEKIADGMKRKIALKGIEYNVFGLSSGAPAHLVERLPDGDGHIVTKWPLRTDASITPTPAEPMTSCGSIKSLDEVESVDDIEVKDWNESDHPRASNGEFSSGGGGSNSGGPHNISLKPDRLEALAKQYGVAPGSKAMATLKEAYDKGHISSAADVHNILSHSAQHGHSDGQLHTAINVHGSGDGKFRASDGSSAAKPSNPSKPSKKNVEFMLDKAGLHENTVAGDILREAVRKGHIGSTGELFEIVKESEKHGHEIGQLHTAINRFSDGPNSDGKFRSRILGNKKSWDETPIEERAAEIKSYLEYMKTAPTDEESGGENPNTQTTNPDWAGYARTQMAMKGVSFDSFEGMTH